MAVIPLVGNFASEEQKDWLVNLNGAFQEHQVLPLADLTSAQMAAVEVAITTNIHCEFHEMLPNLKWVHSVWAGVDKLIPSLKSSPIEIVRLEDPQLAENMAESVLAASYYFLKHYPTYAKQQRQSCWLPQSTRSANQCTVGILGLGQLGRASAKKLVTNDFNVVGWSLSEKRVEGVTSLHGANQLAEVVKQSDILVCLLPATAETRSIIDADTLGKMPDGSCFINFARGELVDMNDLIHRLENGPLEHAILDVFVEEPLPPTHELWKREDVTIFPHVAATTNPMTASAIVANNITEYFNSGKLPKTVDKMLGY